jgi:hypothetical protein
MWQVGPMSENLTRGSHPTKAWWNRSGGRSIDDHRLRKIDDGHLRRK